MPCETCGEALVTGIEQKLRTCAECLGRALEKAANFKEDNLKLQLENEKLQQKIAAVQGIIDEVAQKTVAEKEGQIAQNKGASLEDNPYDKDSDNAACWSYGWLSSELTFTVGKMQAVMLFAANMVSVVRDVAAGGASGDEVAAKLDTVIEKLAPYITPEEQDPATG